MNTNITELSEEKIKELLALKAKVDEKKVKQAEYNERRRVWMKLMVEKAEAAKIVVSDEEVAKEIARLAKTKKA